MATRFKTDIFTACDDVQEFAMRLKLCVREGDSHSARHWLKHLEAKLETIDEIMNESTLDDWYPLDHD